MQRKPIEELTKKQAEELLKFVYPNENLSVIDVKFEIERDKNGYRQITFGGRENIGIVYFNDDSINHDKFILHFDNTKALIWLYKNNFNIEQFLENNASLTEQMDDVYSLMFKLSKIIEGNDTYWTTGYLKNQCKELLDDFFLKDY